MERIPEPDLMNGLTQAEAYAQADFVEPHGYCIERLRQAFPDLSPSGVALDLGCGTGDITLRFAQAFPGWAVDGLDGSTAMLRYAEEALAQANLAERIAFYEAYLPDADAPRNRYDLIFSNSLLHHLVDPGVLWQCIHRWATPGTNIFIMDLLRPDTPEIAAQLVAQYSANEPDILRHDFYHSLLAAYRRDEVEAQLQQANLGHLHTQVVSDRHFILWGSYPD